MFWLILVLKIPIVALLCIVWWAIREPPLPDTGSGEGGGGIGRDPHPRISPPHPSRRGPHTEPAPVAPRRTRVAKRPSRVPKR